MSGKQTDLLYLPYVREGVVSQEVAEGLLKKSYARILFVVTKKFCLSKRCFKYISKDNEKEQPLCSGFYLSLMTKFPVSVCTPLLLV